MWRAGGIDPASIARTESRHLACGDASDPAPDRAWGFPPGTVLEPGGYLVADFYDGAPFSLDSEEHLTLRDAEQRIVDFTAWPRGAADSDRGGTWCRRGDGELWVAHCGSTPGRAYE